MKEQKFDLNDIVLVPHEKSMISSRKECDVYTHFTTRNSSKMMLPLMAAPMDTVVSKENYELYIENGIIPCLPRGTDNFYNDADSYFRSFGLHEIETHLEYHKKYHLHNAYFGAFYTYNNVLIDMANGHMDKLITLVETIKKNWPHINLMVGNVANPETYVNLGLAGADYV